MWDTIPTNKRRTCSLKSSVQLCCEVTNQHQLKLWRSLHMTVTRSRNPRRRIPVNLREEPSAQNTFPFNKCKQVGRGAAECPENQQHAEKRRCVPTARNGCVSSHQCECGQVLLRQRCSTALYDERKKNSISSGTPAWQEKCAYASIWLRYGKRPNVFQRRGG